jgi:tRNA A-37 threonylcarbamoyl transferase component Bud32
MINSTHNNCTHLQTDRYQGEIASAYADTVVIDQLNEIKALLNSTTASKLSKGADYVVKCQLNLVTGPVWIAVKVFKPQAFWKDWYDKKNKSKAQRSFIAARFLQENKIGTPAPVAWFEQWQGNRLIESYYVCLFEPSSCFRDLISEILWDKRDSEPLMELLLHLAPAVRAMHDAGFMHGDMGNQNIFIPKDNNGNWSTPQWIDLNRSKIFDRPLNAKERAFDISRMIMPSCYLRWFLYIYSNHQLIDKDLEKYEESYRKAFTRHRRNSKFRHPIRYLKRKKNTRTIYPHPKNVWLWDEKSAQPMITMTKKDKAQYREWRFLLSSLWKTLTALPNVWFTYKKQLDQSFQNPIEMKNRIGFAMQVKDNYLPHELALHEKAGKPPVLIRFYHHETEADWTKSIDLIQKLKSDNVSIMVAFIQDREAVINPDSWKTFLHQVIPAIVNAVEHIEITHAYNRVKWGIWNNRELIGLMQPAFELQKTYSQIKLTGPACIDFEYAPVIAALKSLPKTFHFSALSHLLYVDRRGAPENHQGKFSTLEKAALLKSLAVVSPNCDNKVIISEVNWPVKHTGIWSPVICPYITPKWRKLEPGEPEDIYAHFMLRYLAITICSGHIDQVFWWRLSAHGYGLIDDQDNFRERPAFTALQFFLELLGNARFEKKLPSDANTYLMEFSKNNQTWLMAWTTRNTQKLDVPYKNARNYLGQPIKVEELTGAPVYLELDTNS